MAGQARIVLFTWVRALGIRHHDLAPDRLSTWAASPERDRYWAESSQTGAGLVGWRVIGANNRELGRGAGPFWRVDEAYEAAHQAQAVLERTETSFWADDLGEWFWTVLLDGEQIAMSSRGYLRQRECIYSVEQFRERFPTAKVVTAHVPRPPSTSRGPLDPPPVQVAARPEPTAAGSNSEVTR
jgi:hypothetical protein